MEDTQGFGTGLGSLRSSKLAAVIALLCICCVESSSQRWRTSTDDSLAFQNKAVMPPLATESEAYLCTTVSLPEKPLSIVGVKPLYKDALVHHMLLLGCQSQVDVRPIWQCVSQVFCPDGTSPQLIYAWGQGAPAVHLPDSVGYKVGPGTNINSIIMQIHFKAARPEEDTSSGVVLSLTEAPMPFSAGMLVYASYFAIPARAPKHIVTNRCCYSGFEPVHGFAYMVHTHSLGRSVSLDKVTPDEVRHRQVVHSPQLPQSYTPMDPPLTFWPGEQLEAACTFNASERENETLAGTSHHDEMCNLYMMLWSQLPVFLNCFNNGTTAVRHGPGGVPKPAVLLAEDPEQWRPPISLTNTPSPPTPYLGQVAGVARGHNGTIWVFHRGSRILDESLFTGKDNQLRTFSAPIAEPVVLQLDQDTGEVLASWGENTFLMPHKITVDRWGFIWLTDQGLQQVFKYDATGTLLLALGKRLAHGTASDGFCGPTQVAVSNNDGRVFVSDGHCNNRVAEFSAAGEFMGDFRLGNGVQMAVPHAVLLDECSGKLLVADRDSAQVQHFDVASREHTGTWDLRQVGLVYGLARGPYGTIFALCRDETGLLGGASSVALLHSDPGQGVEAAWKLEGVELPHDLTVVGGPVRLAGSEPPLAVLIAETRKSGSRLHKFILLPEGATLPADIPGTSRKPAHEHWMAAFAKPAAETQQLPSNLTTSWISTLGSLTLRPHSGRLPSSKHGHSALS